MLKIGLFSKICQVSIKTLRYWDSVGLLKPAQVDPFTGYRYYTIEQVNEVHRIHALKAMGLSLEQIGTMLRDNLTAADLRLLLKVRALEIQSQIAEAEATLTFIESRLRQLDTDDRPPEYEAVLKSMPSVPVYTLRRTVPTMDALVDLLALGHAAARKNEDPRLTALFHDEAFDREHIDVEVAFAAEGNSAPHLADGSPWQRAELPPVALMACTVHSGQWLTLPQGYGFLGKWMAANGYEVVGVGREVFHHIGWEENHHTTVTEIQFPVAPRP